jgi:hypothetical protein
MMSSVKILTIVPSPGSFLNDDPRIIKLCDDTIAPNGQKLPQGSCQQYISESIGKYNPLCTRFATSSLEITHLTLLVTLDEEVLEDLNSKLSSLVDPMVVARDGWIEKKAKIIALEHGEPGAVATN